jgi:guanylate kinase
MLSKLKESITPATPIGFQPTRSGILFVVSSPSGGGKGTLVQRMLDALPDLSYSVSYTTRTPRNGELDGREYFFVARNRFEQMVAANEFLEWASVHGNLYGTARRQVMREINEGRDIVLEVDVQGAASVRELIAESVSIFILPPSHEVLRERLLKRGTDTAEELELRLRNAPAELSHYTAFDYLIVNDDVDSAANRLVAIVNAERSRCKRQEQEVKRIIASFPTE